MKVARVDQDAFFPVDKYGITVIGGGVGPQEKVEPFQDLHCAFRSRPCDRIAVGPESGPSL
jgi:hypothetical protein